MHGHMIIKPTDVYETWHKRYATGGHLKTVYSGILQSTATGITTTTTTITTWLARKVCGGRNTSDNYFKVSK
jgi:hypothetical protein